jgi:hypothetical protein
MHLSLRRLATVAGLLLLVLLCATLAGHKSFPSSTTYRHVTNNSDSGPGSLRGEIGAASDGDVIVFDSAVWGLGTINLVNGEIAINSNITIQGPGPSALTVWMPSNSRSLRVFHVLPGHTVTISGLTIDGGGADGAGIRNDGSTLNLTNCTVTGGTPSPSDVGFGGGIYNDGSAGSANLTIIGCTISNNRVGEGGGGLYNFAPSGGSATVSMAYSSVTGNTASGNLTSSSGGGIYNNGAGATISLTNCTVSNNTAGQSGTVPSGEGGGIYNRDGTVTVIRTTIATNKAYLGGGGISSSGTLEIVSSTINGNRSGGETLDGPQGRGGGVLCSGTMTLTNSTLSGNVASSAGGGLHGNGTITHSTFALNQGGGIYASGALAIGHTILSGVGANLTGSTVTSLGFNMSNDNGGGFLTGPGDQINTDPRLTTLERWGGPTRTHQPSSGSPALDAGDPAFAPPPSQDQRGYSRVYNGRIDIGSFEVGPAPPTPTPPPGPTPCGEIVFLRENFDGVAAPALPPGWTSSFMPGPADCTPSGNCALGTDWVTTTDDPHSPPNSVFHNAPGCVTDSFLETPTFVAGPTNYASFSFWHSFDLENERDGGVLEISIEGGPFVDFAALGRDPGYNGRIASDSFSPIAGRPAWTGNSGGYNQTYFIRFPDVAGGYRVRVRFRLASDCAGAGTGWRIDNVLVYDNIGCQPPTPTPPPPFSPTPTPTPAPTATPLPTPCGVTFSENFDGVIAPSLPGGWSTAVTGSGTSWINSTTFPASAPNSAFAQGQSNIGRTELISPVIAAPATGGILSFQNFFNLHAGFDGMVLEISINGGPYDDIIAAGGSFLAGGYTHTIINCCGSPIVGRMAWSGLSAGWPEAPAYLTSTVNLPPSANGQNINLRWRLVTDSYPITGYVRIDSILLTPAGCTTPTPTPIITPTPLPTATPVPSPAQALNISTRLRVDTGSNIAIGGFIINGTGPRKVAIRGLGPSLGNFGLSDVLGDPTLELRGSDGAIAQNDNWQDNSSQAAQLVALNLAPTHPNESALVAVLDPGAYTALLAGKDQTSGIALIEVYDAESGATSQLANISTRGFVRTGDNAMIGGFILGGSNENTSIVVCGIGPSLAQFGLSNVLPDPTLELRDSNGALLKANDNWQDDPVSAGQLTSRGLSPQNPLESGIFATLAPGAFTAILAGNNAGMGIGLVEIYNVH